MKTLTYTAEDIARIQEVARSGAACDDEDFNPQDYAGDNFDDAYQLGVDDACTLAAREILEALGETW